MRIMLYSVNQNDVMLIIRGADYLVDKGTTDIPCNSSRSIPGCLNDQFLLWWQFRNLPQKEVTELSIGILMKLTAIKGHNKSKCDCHLSVRRVPLRRSILFNLMSRVHVSCKVQCRCKNT